MPLAREAAAQESGRGWSRDTKLYLGKGNSRVLFSSAVTRSDDYLYQTKAETVCFTGKEEVALEMMDGLCTLTWLFSKVVVALSLYYILYICSMAIYNFLKSRENCDPIAKGK